jgi:hypothetical protein
MLHSTNAIFPVNLSVNDLEAIESVRNVIVKLDNRMHHSRVVKWTVFLSIRHYGKLVVSKIL